jgi:O-antigen/teichoic acid export membrane protein
MLSLGSNLPPPLKMDRDAYRRYRMRLLLLILLWIAMATLAVIYWADIPVAAKIGIGVLGIAFNPGISPIEQVFTSYERYEKEGI